VQLIRNAVARKFVLMQRKAFETMRRFDAGVLLISLDETEMQMQLGAAGTSAHVIVMHARLHLRRGQHVERLEVVVPPAAIEATTSAH